MYRYCYKYKYYFKFIFKKYFINGFQAASDVRPLNSIALALDKITRLKKYDYDYIILKKAYIKVGILFFVDYIY